MKVYRKYSGGLEHSPQGRNLKVMGSEGASAGGKAEEESSVKSFTVCEPGACGSLVTQNCTRGTCSRFTALRLQAQGPRSHCQAVPKFQECCLVTWRVDSMSPSGTADEGPKKKKKQPVLRFFNLGPNDMPGWSRSSEGHLISRENWKGA